MELVTEDPEDRVLVYRGAPPPSVPVRFSRVVEDEHVTIVPWDEAAFRALQANSIWAPHPAFATYDWPGPPPFDAQIVTAQFLLYYERAFVLSEMGTGKTRAALYALDVVRSIYESAGRPFRALILAPLSTIRTVWANEIADVFLDRFRVVVLHGSRDYRLKLLRSEGWNVAIANHEILHVCASALMSKRFDVVVVDEIAVYRNRQTYLTTRLRGLVNGRRVGETWQKPVRWVWGLTGTPTPTAPTDAWALKAIVRPGEEGSYAAFENATTQLEVPTNPFVPHRYVYRKRIPKANATEYVRTYLTPSIRFTRDAMLDLPPTTYSTRQVPLTKEQRKLLAELKREARVVIRQHSVTSANAAVFVGKAFQIALGVVLDDSGQPVALASSERYSEMLELIHEAPAKVLVFAIYRAVIERAVEYLREKHIDVAAVHGAVTLAQRTVLFRRFQDPDDPLRVLVAHPETMAHGLTLTEAATVVWLGPTWSAELYAQACARITRPGQTRHTHIVHLWSTSIERRAYELVERRLDWQQTLLNLCEEFDKSESEQESDPVAS